MSPQREKVTFDINIPQTVTLAYSEGKIVSGRFGEQVMYSLAGNQVMFLDLGVAQKINLLEANAGESICICKRNSKVWDVWLSPATEKTRAARGMATEGRSLDPDPERPASEQQDLVPVLQASVRAAQDRRYNTLRVAKLDAGKNGSNGGGSNPAPGTPSNGHIATDGHSNQCPQNSTAPRPAETPRPPIAQGWAQFLLSQVQALVDVYAAALAYADKHGSRVKPEDVRALLTTAFIAQTKNGGPNVA